MNVLASFWPSSSSTPSGQGTKPADPVAPKKPQQDHEKLHQNGNSTPLPPQLPVPLKFQSSSYKLSLSPTVGLPPAISQTTSLLVDDILQLPTIVPNAVVELLRNRFMRDELYTHLGRLVLAINPYKRVEGLYSEAKTLEYSKRNSAVSGNKYLAPHLFTIGNDALDNVKRHGSDQIISISGESGSGKTESARLLISYLVNKNNNASDNKLRRICQQIMDGLGILESFGNASTSLNFNSSRHGRLIDLAFQQNNLVSVQVSDYLLERSRVVFHGKSEKNYHIFYEFIGGLSDDQRRSYQLDSLVTCDYFTTGLPAPTNDLKDRFSNINARLVTLGFNVEELKALLAMLASVCHLGTIKFERIVSENGAVSELHLASLKPLQTVANLIKVSEGTLATLLTVKTTDAGGERLTIPLAPDQAFVVRDAIAKFIYAKLFSWLSSKVNISLTKSLANANIAPKSGTEGPENKISHIGILDIFGFEDFSHNNSLEQLCINFASESLHAYFLKEVIKMEQESYIRDGLKWQKIEMNDNANCIDLLVNKKIGIMTILDDHCFMPNASDVSFLNKCNELNRFNPAYDRAKSSEEFGIAHYAGKVWYQTRGFLEKNRDSNRPDIIDLLVKSQNPIIASVFSSSSSNSLVNVSGSVDPVASPPRRTRCFTTVSSMYQESLSQLIAIVNRCQPHFVRCIRPNRTKKPGFFDIDCVLDQLRCGGIIDAARVRKAGYPVRVKHQEFVATYAPLLVSSEAVESLQPAEACRYVLTKVGAVELKDYQVGRSLVFVTDSMFRRLEAEVQTKRWAAISKWQKTVFRYLDEQREIKRAAERKRMEEEAAQKAKQAAMLKLTNNTTSSSSATPKTPARLNDSAIGMPTPLVQPVGKESADFLQEVVTFLLNWQLVDDDRHIIPAINNLHQLAVAIPYDASVLRTVVGAFMQTNFPRGGPNKQDVTTPNPGDAHLTSKIVSLFVADKQISGLQQLVLATLVIHACQTEGSIETALQNFHNIISSHSANSSGLNSSGGSNGKEASKKLSNDYVIQEVMRSLTSQTLNSDAKNLLWILLLHILSSYDVSPAMAKSILTTVATDSPNSPSITAPHLVLYVYQKLFPVIRQLVRFSWTCNRVLPPTLLEWIANIRFLRMALTSYFIDGSSCNVEISSHTCIEEFASTCIRTKYQVSADIQPQLLFTGWATALTYSGSERVELWPEAKLLDLISHIELPIELQPKGRFPGLGLIRSLPAIISPHKNKDHPSSSFLSGMFAQISQSSTQVSSVAPTNDTTKASVISGLPRQTSTPKSSGGVGGLGHLLRSLGPKKNVSFDDGSQPAPIKEESQEFLRHPSVSSTNSNLARIDDYINNLFDFAGPPTTMASSSGGPSSISLTTVTSLPTSGTSAIVDTRSLYAHMSNTVVNNSTGDAPLGLMEGPTIGSVQKDNPLSATAATNVRQAAKVLDRFLKPDMINVQQTQAQAAVLLSRQNHFRSAFTNEGNSLFKLITMLDDQLGPAAMLQPDSATAPSFITYANPQWQLVTFKSFLTPSESKVLLDADRNFLRLILAQIVGDVQSARPGMFSRLSAAEHTGLLNMIYTRKLTKESVLASETFTSTGAPTASTSKIAPLDIDFLKLVIKMAVDMKLYFAAIYPVSGVIDESGASTIVTDVALAPRYLSMISRRIDPTTSSRILDVVKSFQWADVEDVVIAGESSVKISVGSQGEFAFTSENVDLLADRLSAFTIEAQASVKFQASRDSVPNEPSDRQLVLRKNDIIYVLDAQPQDGLLYGACRGRCGFFPIAAVTPLDLGVVPLELRRHFADKRIQDCDLIVDAGSLTSEHLLAVEGWLQRADAGDRPSDTGDNIQSLVARLSMRRQRENVEQMALGGNANTAVDDSLEVILLNVSDDLRPLCAQCASLVVKFIRSEEQSTDPSQRREFVSGILATGLQYPLISDEIFLQTVKLMVTSDTPPSPQLIYRTLCLMSILAKFFRCSDTLRPYMFLFLADQLATGKNRDLILETAASMTKVALMGSRRSLPSSDEIDYCCSLIEGRRNPSTSVFVRIFLPGQRRVAAYVDSCSLVREIVDAVMTPIGVETPTGRVGVGSSTMKLSLTESYEYRLYYRKSPKEPFILVTGASYILDLFKSSSNTESAPQHLDLVIRRLSWLFPVRSILNTSERSSAPHPYLVDMLSFQMMRSWLEANWSPLHVDAPEELASFVATTAALHHRASIPAGEERPPSAAELSSLMPRWVYQMRPDWLKTVQQTYFEKAAKLPPQTARRQLTALLVKECPLGASSYFILLGAILPTSALRGAAILGLNAKGAVILHPETRVPLFFAAYPQILSLAVENNTTSSSNNPQRQAPPGSVQVVLRMSPAVLLPAEVRESAVQAHNAPTNQPPVVMRLMSLPSDCLIQVLQHHIDLYAAINGTKDNA